MSEVGCRGISVVGDTQRTGEQDARMQQVESRGWDAYSQKKAVCHLTIFQYSPKFMPESFALLSVISVNSHMD